MSINPFDDGGTFCVLVNDEERLWPTFRPMPDGWRVAFGADTRGSCLEFVEQSWTDMRPRSPREAMVDG
ncbi:MbtH family protein [Mycobacterium sp. 1274761.0]|uniref:MbtH family protein n=1 Tax=Mycobacterium sp. 1274761.0 TaxID=1834077 RepID=UPI00080175AE|nr:MbtH family protein [Mycobacterium sp. 1274761.0]OBK70344.1 protein mbtH [Mycobacterium sp. 1274761.0]